MMTITQLGLLGEKRMYFENNKYAIGAMPVNLNITKNKLLIWIFLPLQVATYKIIVPIGAPGWPLLALDTISALSNNILIRTISNTIFFWSRLYSWNNLMILRTWERGWYWCKVWWSPQKLTWFQDLSCGSKPNGIIVFLSFFAPSLRFLTSTDLVKALYSFTYNLKLNWNRWIMMLTPFATSESPLIEQWCKSITALLVNVLKNYTSLEHFFLTNWNHSVT